MTISDVKIKDNPEFINTTIKMLHNISTRQFALNMDFDIKKALHIVKVKVKADIAIRFMEDQHFTQTIDICSFLKNIGKSWQSKFIFGDLNQYDIPRGCPIPAKLHQLHNSTSDISFIPMKLIPDAKFLAIFDIFTFVKKRATPITLLKFEGALKHNDL